MYMYLKICSIIFMIQYTVYRLVYAKGTIRSHEQFDSVTFQSTIQKIAFIFKSEYC
jgi:hypothetical protein